MISRSQRKEPFLRFYKGLSPQATPARFELATLGLGIRCSIQLSYGAVTHTNALPTYPNPLSFSTSLLFTSCNPMQPYDLSNTLSHSASF